MDTTQSPTGSARRHRPRRSTRGPLDAVDDPLADTPQTPSPGLNPSTEQTPVEPVASEIPSQTLSLNFLQDRTSFLSVPSDDIPEAFLNSQNQPPADAPLASLVQKGYFRRAAETALDDLLNCPEADTRRIFELLYTRLACMVLISRPDVASHEAVPITEFLARSPPGAEDIVPLVPWELRLLLVRLQSIAATDGGRRGIMSLYALAAEVREHIKTAKDTGQDEQITLWSERLRDLGLRVADMLVEMGELETATRHLDNLANMHGDDLAYRKALLRLRVGDLTGAQKCVEKIHESERSVSVDTLLKAANGDFSTATEMWRQNAQSGSNALLTSNLAVGMLYIGRIAQARETLETLAQQLPAFPGLLFNLGTVYELCTENAIERKTTLAQAMSNKTPAPDTGGWERANFEFKL